MEPINISLDWLKIQASALNESPFILVQGYEWTGLGQFSNGEFKFGRLIEWRWSEIWDVRLFGDTGEWHCWKSGDGSWFGRFAATESVPKEFRIERDYVLWGRSIEKGKNWAQEANGASVFIPIPVEGNLAQRPLRLMAWELIQSDPKTGQCFIADAMLRGVRQTREEEVR
jgi:CRISPR-associated protein (TIGR03984 family)